MLDAIKGPREIYSIYEINGHAGLRTADEYRALAKRLCRATQTEANLGLVAYVNHGRWCGDCVCHGGLSVSLEWSLACCVSCGAIYTRIILPDDHVAIAATLARRERVQDMNWMPGETLANLIYENVVVLGMES